MSPAGLALRIVFSIVYVACAWHIWMVFVAPWREEFPDADIRGVCAAVAQRLVDRVRSLVLRRTGAIDMAMRDMMVDFRLQQCRKVASFLSLFIGPSLLAFVVMREIRPEDPDDTEHLVIAYGLCTAMYLIILLVASDCVRLTAFKLDIIFMFASAASIANVVTMAGDPRFFTNHTLRHVLLLMAAVVYMDYRKAILWHMAFACVNMWRYTHNSSTILLVENQQSGILFFACREAFVCVSVILGTAMVENWLEESFRVQITTHNQKRAMLKLASYQCDAVVWLTPDLRLSAPAPQLAEMLFLANVRNGLVGRQFANYIANDSDRERFREFIALSTAASEAEGLPAVLYIDLRESTGQTFTVEILHSCFMDVSNQMGHFLGISERRDQEPQPIDVQELAPGRAVAQPMPQELPAGDVAIVSRAPSASQSSASDQIEQLMPIIPEHQVPEPAALLLDAVMGEILGCTNELLSLTGPLVQKTNIMDMMDDSEPFLQWIQHQTNDLRWEADRESAPFDLKLSWRTSNHDSKIEVLSKAYITQVRERVSVADMGLDLRCDGEVFGMLCVLWLRNVEMDVVDPKKKNKTKTKRKRDTTTSEPTEMLVEL